MALKILKVELKSKNSLRNYLFIYLFRFYSIDVGKEIVKDLKLYFLRKHFNVRFFAVNC